MDSTNKSKYSSFGLSSLYGFFTVPVNYLFPKDKPSKTNAKSQAASNYAKLCAEVSQDLQAIGLNIDRFNAELNGHNNNSKIANTEKYNKLKKNEKLESELKNSSIFGESEINVEHKKQVREAEKIMSKLQDLMKGYRYSLDKSPTAQEIQDAYKELEEHHQKTVNLALILFPKLDGILNYTRNEREKIKMEF